MFKKPKIEINLDIPRESFALGTTFDGKIDVLSQEEFDATEVRAELRCVERVRRERWVYNPQTRTNIRQVYWDTQTLLSDDIKTTGELHIVPSFKKTYPITVHIPASGRETYDGIDANLTWSIKGVVAVDGRPDATSETIELQVIRASAATVKEEVRMVKCEYCGAMMPATSSACPICGAPRKS
jgi:hypothetical protein